MSCRRRNRFRGRRRGFRHRRDRENVFARVNNRFELENSREGEFENLQQSGNALALHRSNNNDVEQENKIKSEDD